MNTHTDVWPAWVTCMNYSRMRRCGFLPIPLQGSWRPWLTLAFETQCMCLVVASQRSTHRTMTTICDYIITYNYKHVGYNLEPITLSKKNDKNFIPKITFRGLRVTFLSEHIRYSRKLSITFNLRFNMYDKKIWKAWRHIILTHPLPLSQTVTRSPRAWRTL